MQQNRNPYSSEARWHQYLNAYYHAPQIHPPVAPQIHPPVPVPDMPRYIYTVPPLPAAYRMVSDGTRHSHAPVRLPKKEIEPTPQLNIHKPSPENEPLPKLTIDKVKSLIKPIDRHTNHEISLPKDLEPYFGTGWVCRYYHATPAWGFIPPKGSGVRRADGFKALMARLEELQHHQKKASEVEVDYANVSTASRQGTMVRIIQNQSSESSPSPLADVKLGPNCSQNDNLYTYRNPPERYTPYFIYFLLENMRLLQESNTIDPKIYVAMSKFYDPREHPRPEKYMHCILPPFWYLSGHRDGVDVIMKNLSSQTSNINILEQWRHESDEVRNYCEMLAMFDQHTRFPDGSSNKRKRVSESDTESIEYMKLLHPFMPSRCAESNSGDVSCLSSASSSLSPATVPQGEKMSSPCKDLDLHHQVTFETKGSRDDVSSTAAGPPKKRFLHSSRNEHDVSSGIGLLAYAASML